MQPAVKFGEIKGRQCLHDRVSRAFCDSVAALLQMNEAPLLTTCHSIQVARILKWRVARMYSAEVLLKVKSHTTCTQLRMAALRWLHGAACSTVVSDVILNFPCCPDNAAHWKVAFK